MIDDSDAGAEIGDIAADRGGRPDLADIKDRLLPVWHAQPTRAVQVLPLGLELAVAVEHLHAVVLAVSDIDPPISIAADIVDDVELAGIGARLAPRAQEVALAVEDHHRMHAAIKDIDVIVAVDSDPANLLERPPVGQLRPISINLISIIAASHDH